MKVRIPSEFKNNNKTNMYLAEGTKVKLNYQEIINSSDYIKKVPAYKTFVENNKDTIFTVEYDKVTKHNPILVCLKEDTSTVKWLFHSEYDLIII